MSNIWFCFPACWPWQGAVPPAEYLFFVKRVSRQQKNKEGARAGHTRQLLRQSDSALSPETIVTLPQNTVHGVGTPFDSDGGFFSSSYFSVSGSFITLSYVAMLNNLSRAQLWKELDKKALN